MSAAHTPGPWHVGELSLDIITTKGQPVCSPSDDFNEEQWAVDARLIACAPELLDALNGLYGLLQLFAARDDVPPEVKNFAANHRAVEALAVLTKVQS